jgi:hypothetical protein
VKRLLLGGFAALAFAAACAGGPRSRLSPGLRDQYQLQADELVSLGPSASLYEVVERLRHRWLEARSSNLVPEATDQIGVYVGSRRLGGVNELRYIAARNVASARFIAAREASALYGPGHANGVILVEMK